VYLLFFHRLADRDLWSSHEARAAMDAQSLLDGGALPHLFDGRAELQKPPLYYAVVAAIASLRGGAVDALAVRLPAAAGAAGCVLALVLLGRLAGRPRDGALAALLLATAIHFTWLARIGRIDMPLAFTTTVAVASFYLALQPSWNSQFSILNSQFSILLVAYLSLAAALLLKGPVGIVLPCAAVAGWLLLEHRWPAFWEGRKWLSLLRQTGAWWGVPLVLALTVPVFVWLEQASAGRFAREFFWLHNVQRGLGGSRLRAHPWWLYGPYFALYFLPWSPLLLVAGWRRVWRDDPLARLGLGWMLAVVVVLSAARFKRADYLLPAYPGAALLAAAAVRELLARWPRPALAGLTVAVLGVAAGWLLRLEAHLPAREPFRDYRNFAALVRREAPAPAEIVLFRTEAHALAFRLGRPVTVLVGWDELRARLSSPGRHHVVAPPSVAAEMRRRLPELPLEELARNTELAGGDHERPLVLLRRKDEGGRMKDE
jgi:4-amino-4-deoxy-L-arabinose transferase-like glycosyltransferase